MRLPAELASDAVRLRAWRPEDIDALVAMAGDPESARRTRVPEPYTADEARRFLATVDLRLADGFEAGYAICEPAGPPVGSIGVRAVLEDRRCELGYLMAPAGRGRGLMTAAVTLVTGWLLGPGGFARVGIMVATDNPASQAVARRAGFHEEGVLRGWHELKGERQNLISFSRVPGDADG